MKYREKLLASNSRHTCLGRLSRLWLDLDQRERPVRRTTWH